MPKVRVYLFGYPRVECDGASVAVPRRKALALLAYLGVTQTHHSRDVLASLLWPEEESAKGYAFLRNALWVLHQTPVDPWIVASRHMVGLQPDASLWVDVAEFRRLVKTCQHHRHAPSELCEEGVAALREAAELARDGFLSGFVAEDTRSFEEWQFSEADALAQELASTFERLCEHLIQAGDGASALHYAQRLIGARPLHEPAYCRLMRLQARGGDRAGALRTFDECVRVLDLELSLEPSDETRRLAEEIRSQSWTPPHEPNLPARKKAPAPVRAELPNYRIPVVGRSKNLEEVLALFSGDDCRLVTVTGAGGAGKTRLAVEVAERATQFEEGAVFVSLVDVGSPTLVPAAILGALGERAEARGDPPSASGEDHALRELVRHITDRDLLIVLDNAEHLARDPRWLDALVRATSDPRFLVTSRQEMGVPNETVYPIEGLECPPSDAAEGLTQFPAVQLFLQAARRADARFAPSDGDMRAVAAISRHLAGSPLAIELAASWIRTLDCRAVEAEIARSVDFLKTDRQLLPRRHRSLRAAFEGSWALLDRDGRAAFRALSIFRGGFTPESALRVAGVAVPALAALVAKSLLERREAGRYEMLEVVRQYASERLHAVPEDAERLQDRHAEYFLALLASQESRLKGADQRAAIAALALDEANIAAAWAHAAARKMLPELGHAAMGLFLFCDMTSRFLLGRELFRLAAGAAEGKKPETVRRGVYFSVLEAWFAGFVDMPAAKDLFVSTLERGARLPLDRDLAFAWTLAAFERRRLDMDSYPQQREALAYFDEHGHAWEAGAACEALTASDIELPEALALARRSSAIRRRIGDGWGVAMSLCSEGFLLEAMGDLEDAARKLEKSADLRRELGLDPAGLAASCVALGRIEVKLGRTADARRNLEEAVSVGSRVGYVLVSAVALRDLALLETKAGHPEIAREHAQGAVQAFLAAGLPGEAAEMGRALEGAAESPRKRRSSR